MYYNKINIMKFSIITPTIGHPTLSKLLVSVSSQLINEDIQIEHIIVIDGPEYKNEVQNILNIIPIQNNHERHIIELPYNTGKKGYFGHKIYSSITHLVNGDFVIYLDNDNWLDNDHILNYYNAIKQYNYDWMFCLRKIWDIQGNYICNDDCESLGYISNSFYNRDVYFIDTNCTCVKKEIAVKFCYVWNNMGTNNNNDPDRIYSRILMTLYPNYECTFKYSVNYSVENRTQSVTQNMFLNGNQLVYNKYGEIPWNKKQLFIAHFDVDNTEKIIKRIYENHKECIAFDQWSLNIMDKMDDYICISAYNPFIPSNKKVLFHMCHINLLPKKVLERKDITKILYTIESPNIRHQEQWDYNFLLSNFTHIITYWKTFINNSNKITHNNTNNNIIYFPFIHRYDLTNSNDVNCIKTNDNLNKQVCIVLENRNLCNHYQINGTKLNALDYLRWEYCKELGKQVDCYGSTWKKYSDIINYKATQSRFLNKVRTIDIMQNYTFALIIENCDAEGYVSEKIYDAISVGCIPIYYGNNNLDVNIPSDCYIDLKNIKPKVLPKFLNILNNELINTYKQNIYEKRMNILKNVSINKYNDLLKTII